MLVGGIYPKRTKLVNEVITFVKRASVRVVIEVTTVLEVESPFLKSVDNVRHIEVHNCSEIS